MSLVKRQALGKRVPLLLDGLHDGCAECRVGTFGACEFDGKVSITRFRGKYYLYTRANLYRTRGGRHVQVAISVGSDPAGPYLPFVPVSIAGYSVKAGGNVYFAAVKPNPIDERTLLGLFPTALVEDGYPGLVGWSISCDGLYWAPLIQLTQCLVIRNRTTHQPVDGFVRREGAVQALIHTNVPIHGARPRSAKPSLVPHTLNPELLQRVTRAARAHLPGCAAPSAAAPRRMDGPTCVHTTGGRSFCPTWWAVQ